MLSAYEVADVRAAEERAFATLPARTLMDRAAAGLATACIGLMSGAYAKRVVLVVGSGNNGGDALFAGARLARRGAAVTALLLNPERTHAGGLKDLRAAGGVALDAETVANAQVKAAVVAAELVIDGVLGIGGRGGLKANAASIAALVRAVAVPVVSVDLPSGVEADTGEVLGEAFLPSALVVTFGAYKPALFIGPTADQIDDVTLVDIGLDFAAAADRAIHSLDDTAASALLPNPGRDAHKYTRGVLTVFAGSGQYTGAAVLAVAGALAGGAGMVRYVGPPAAQQLVRAAQPEVVIGDGHAQAIVVGPGFGEGRTGEVESALAASESGVSVLIDADGLKSLPRQRSQPSPLLLTPHAGELAALLGVERSDVEASRLHFARLAAQRWQATVLLKGSSTVVADADGRTMVNRTGTSALATAGTGDVLAGLAGAFLAAGLTPLNAGALAAHLHGLAGQAAADEHGYPTATQVAAALTGVLARLRTTD